MSNFDDIYQSVALSRNGEAVSVSLKPQLAVLYDALSHRPIDLANVKTQLIALLSFLNTPTGRTNANCWAIDLFFALPEHWDVSWLDLPEAYREILGDMGGALHDTIEYPAIAHNFWSTPEQLLERVSHLPVHIELI